MIHTSATDKDKLRKDKAKSAINLAVRSFWSEAAGVNRSILNDFPDDSEARNRLGKALSELGRNREAEKEFKQVLKISPRNGIARKNLDRLAQLKDITPISRLKTKTKLRTSVEGGGKAGVTHLTNLGTSSILLTTAPGHPVRLEMKSGSLSVTNSENHYLGQVESRMASRLIRFMKAGNNYEATITSVSENELTLIIREVHRDPSMIGVVSFPSNLDSDHRESLPNVSSGDDQYPGDESAEESYTRSMKDWSDDDTEPGDDETFTPAIHRIIGSSVGNTQ